MERILAIQEHRNGISMKNIYTIFPSTRQLILADIDLVQTSCGFGVQRHSFEGNTDIHFEWAEKR
ncbi:MAG: hypothetical protein IPF81_13880 [Bacteroidetes bacterium]|nr:hypothetical protein [Bacteroidota bacterium]